MVYYLACCQGVFEDVSYLTYFHSAGEFREDPEYGLKMDIKKFTEI